MNRFKWLLVNMAMVALFLASLWFIWLWQIPEEEPRLWGMGTYQAKQKVSTGLLRYMSGARILKRSFGSGAWQTSSLEETSVKPGSVVASVVLSIGSALVCWVMAGVIEKLVGCKHSSGAAEPPNEISP